MMRRSTARNPDSGSNPTRHSHSRRRTLFSTKPAATPLPQWKFDHPPLSGADPPHNTETRIQKNAERTSARKIAAGIWRSELQAIEVDPIGFSNPQQKCQDVPALINPLLEGATKWDTECSKKPSMEVYRSVDHLKLLMDQQMTKASTLAAKLNAELKWARARVVELEAKRHASKKQLDSFLKKLVEEKTAWRAREHERIRSAINATRDDLQAERKNRRRTEVLNTKLIDELAEAKKSARRLSQDCERERKARELVEEVCDELAKEVGDDRAEVEEARRESVRVREELEEERKMLQIAESWREERVQMKLVDSKKALADQCAQLEELRSELEEFLSSRNGTNSDDAEIVVAELLIEAVAEAVKMHDVKTFAYVPPPASEDIFAIFEELQCREEKPNDSPATDIFLGKPASESGRDDSEWETLSDESNDGLNEAPRKDRGLLEPIANISEEDYCVMPDLERWSSPDSANPHAARGLKGCIDWPRGGGHKHSLKAKLLEAKIESEKVQIRHVLKQKT